MNKLCLTVLVVLSLGACSRHYCGTYQGVLPAASGPGIETTLILNSDGTYDMESIYMDEVAGVFEDEGTYSVSDGIITLNSPEMEQTYFRMEEGQVRRLDTHQKPVIGELEEHYILKQTKECE